MVMVMAMIYGGDQGNGDEHGIWIEVMVMMDNDDKGTVSISY